MTEIVQKAEFARRAGVGKSAVSNWIAAGQLTLGAGGGLVVQGKREMVDVAIAAARLGIALDPAQSLGNGSVRRRALSETAAPPVEASPVEPDRYHQAKTDEAEIRAARARLSYKKELGAWVSREDAATETRKAVAALVSQLTHAVEQDIPLTLAAELGIAPATLRAAIRRAWREARARIAKDSLAEAADLDANALATEDA